MSRWLLLLVPLTGACFSTTSNPGAFLTSVRVVPDGVETTRCDISYTVTHVMNDRGERGDRSNCSEETVKFPAMRAELPAHCWPSVEVWIGTPSTAERKARWAAIPVECQELVAGGGS